MKKGLLLLSGGIDSPVAGRLAMENGAEVFAVHFPTVKITGKESIQKSIELCKKIPVKKLFVVDLSDQFAEISRKCEPRLYFVLTKRLMFRVAEKIAEKNKVGFLLSGENLGQVSSQTLSNLSTIDSVTKMPIVRPLLCLDKVQIIGLAGKIGTLEISFGKEICDALGPKHPATKTSLPEVLEEEKRIDVKKIVESALNDLLFYQP
ncbi:MAG: 7-cyano-7-deazaguanine synthase [Candidatus Diapherotrites archaeon]|nr:7-cyano-7-deazaguanine synthase [Candidatus Diapherotrites archaeon]